MDSVWYVVIGVVVVTIAVVFSKFKRMTFVEYSKKYDDL
jgi:hypothetical protein